MQQIPITTDAYQSFKTTLEGQVVNIDLRWQDVSESWFISVYTSSVVYIENKRLCTNVLILAQFPLIGFKGGIIASSDTAAFNNLNRNSFQNDFKLYYLNEEDLNGLSTL